MIASYLAILLGALVYAVGAFAMGKGDVSFGKGCLLIGFLVLLAAPALTRI